jgi:hypothetical protein
MSNSARANRKLQEKVKLNIGSFQRSQLDSSIVDRTTHKAESQKEECGAQILCLMRINGVEERRSSMVWDQEESGRLTVTGFTNHDNF